MPSISNLQVSYLCVAAVFVSAACIFFTIWKGRTDKPQNRLFILLMSLTAVGAFCDAAVSYIHPLAEISTRYYALHEVFRLTYFISHTALAPFFSLYVMEVNGTGREKTKKFYLLYVLPFIFTEILVILNPFFNTIYTYNENFEFTRMPGETVIYIAAALYILFGIIQFFFFWNAINTRIRVALSVVMGIVIFGIVLQMLFKDLKVELFAESLAMLGLMLTVEDEDYRTDALTRVYNGRGLIMDVENLLSTNHSFYVYIIRITNTDLINRILGQSELDELRIKITEFLKTLIPRYYIYTPENSLYAIADPRINHKEFDCLSDAIGSRFKKPWDISGMDVMINVAIMPFKVPDEIKDSETIIHMTKSSVSDEGESVILRGEKLDKVLRRRDVEKAVRRAIAKRSFTVYYQPIYDATKKRITTAEALVRLIDPELGFISPGEFIPIAEGDGLINDVDMIVLDKVCDFERRHPLQTLGLDHIHINISAYQLMYSNFMDEFVETLKRHGIDSDGINIEITESADITKSEEIQKGINELRDRDFEFSLDDYGTGYSNLSNVLSMNYRNIKMDKSLLDVAGVSESGKTMLLETIKIIRKVDINVIQEGVETEDQLELVMNAGCDLIQGFYFSKPLPEEDFIDYIRNFRWTEYLSKAG